MKSRVEPQASTISGESEQRGRTDGEDLRTGPALALVWSHAEPGRVGEVVVVPPATRGVGFTIGRATESGEDDAVPLLLTRLRPSASETTGPLQDPKISRWQVLLRVTGDELQLERRGRGPLAVNGRAVERAAVRAGDVVECAGRCMFMVVRRPLAWPHLPAVGSAFAFGEADAHGIVGESAAAWELRRQLAFVAGRGEHVLVHGASGSGKELAARAIHAASRRGARALVARNAATIPEALVDAELFGNLRNYPNPGMPERPGLLGEADGSSLLLDEIGELPLELQGRLLRVMDGGEYQRLGEARRRITDVRVLGATNRDPAALKHDLLARFALRVRVPGLGERPEDGPLLARHLVRGLVAGDPELRARFLADDQPRLAAALVLRICREPPATHTRGLAALLLRSLADSPGATLEPPEAEPEAHEEAAEVDADGPTRAQIVAALARVGGVRERAWRELGLRSRFQLHRLLKRHGIA